MKLIESFQDLQNETCEIHADRTGNFYIGRRGQRMMNLNMDILEKMFEKAHTFNQARNGEINNN